MYYMKPLKSPTHIHLFDENFYGFEIVFLHYDFGIFSTFYMRIMQSENSATNIHTHYRQSETAPPYTRIICEKNFAQIYMKNRGAAGMMCARLIGVDISAFVCITFCICGHRLKKVVFVVDWLMSKFDYKSVIKLYKFIVKM